MNDDSTRRITADISHASQEAPRPMPRRKPPLSYDRHGMTPLAAAAMDAYVRSVNGLERAEYENDFARWSSDGDTAPLFSGRELAELREAVLMCRGRAKAALVSWEARLFRERRF